MPSSLFQHITRQHQPYTPEDEERSQFLDQQITQDQALQNKYTGLTQPTVDLRGYDPDKNMGTASQIAGPSQGNEGGGIMGFLRGIPGNIREGVGQAMADPTRRAMLAFGAKMMDFSAPKWQQFETGTQISHAIQAGLDEYAKATNTKPPKVTTRKYMKGDVQWEQPGHWIYGKEGRPSFYAYGEGTPVYQKREEKAYKPGDYIEGDPTKYKQFPAEKKKPKYSPPNLDNKTAASAENYLNEDHPDYGLVHKLVDKPYDYAHQEKLAKFRKRGGLTATNENFGVYMEHQQAMEDIKVQGRFDVAEYRHNLYQTRWLEEQAFNKKHGLGPISREEWESRLDYKEKKTLERQIKVQAENHRKTLERQINYWKYQNENKPLGPGVYEFEHPVTGKKIKVTHAQLVSEFRQDHPKVNALDLALANFLLDIDDDMAPQQEDTKGQFSQWAFDRYGIDLGRKDLARPATPNKVMKPQTQAEVDALPPGTRYFDPDANEVYIKD